jgi:solute carrier family 26 (sodium-independent sulfate anion transporter), member 11
MITPDRCLIFPSVDYVRNLINKQGLRNHIPIVIDCSFVYGTDFTASTVMKSLTSDFSVFEGLDPVDFVVYYREEYLDELLKERSYDPKVLTV